MSQPNNQDQSNQVMGAVAISCPFCGSEDSMWLNQFKSNLGTIYGRRTCEYCGTKGPYTEKANDLSIWNTRKCNNNKDTKMESNAVLVERVVAGLQRLQRKPDALVFVDDLLDLTWDISTVCGITVFHGTGFLPPFNGKTVLNCPFFPVWNNDYLDALVETRHFVDGYCSIIHED